MNILPHRQRALQMLILFVLVQVALVVLVYITKSWSNHIDDLFSNLEHEEKIVKHEKILRVWEESNNHTLNFFTRQLSTNDEKRLVNLKDFDFKIKKENLCSNETVLLLVIVSSAPGNQLKRQVIRETWGQSDNEVKVIFMLGDNPNDTKTIQIEAMTFNDIVQGTFLDSYKNMTYKSTMGLKYAIYNCPRARFLLKCDDDVLINMPLLKNFLKNDLQVMDAKNSIFCTVNHARTPIRDPVGNLRKWYLSYEEWPEEYFPMYCAGWYFIMRMDVAFDIYRQAQNSTFFWIDDVFLTGIAAKNVHGLKYVDVSKYTLADIDIRKILNGDLEDMTFLVGSFNMIPEHIRKLWQYVLSRPVKESVLNGLFKVVHQN